MPPRTIAELMAKRTGTRPGAQPTPPAGSGPRPPRGRQTPQAAWIGTPAPTRVDPHDPESIRLV